MKLCSVDGCEDKSYCRGMCSMHYQRLTRTGTTDPRPVLSIDDRYERDVIRNGYDECWGWAGRLSNMGYATMSYSSGNRTKHLTAHRYSFVRSGRELPDGAVVRHTCDNPPCTNPRHLISGTQADNMQDAKRRGRMNTDGLAIGWTLELPPRPCRECGTQIEGGRNRLCAPCKKQARREAVRRCKAKAKGKAA